MILRRAYAIALRLPPWLMAHRAASAVPTATTTGTAIAAGLFFHSKLLCKTNYLPFLKKMVSQEENVYMAKLSEQAERYDEMVQYMKEIAKSGVELNVEERNLLSVAYKNVIGSRRASWRIVSSIEQKEESKGNTAHVAQIVEYRSKIEKELTEVCNDILAVLNDNLIPSSTSGESKVFYYKMKGDYHRYLAEFTSGDARKETADQAHEAYKAATGKSFFN